MYSYNIRNHSDDSLIHVFSTEEARSVKNYKREKQQYKNKKSKKENETNNKENIDSLEKSTIDIRC